LASRLDRIELAKDEAWDDAEDEEDVDDAVDDEGLDWAAMRVARTDAENWLDGGLDVSEVAAALEVVVLEPVELAGLLSKSCMTPATADGPGGSTVCNPLNSEAIELLEICIAAAPIGLPPRPGLRSRRDQGGGVLRQDLAIAGPTAARGLNLESYFSTLMV
jgi:hypothetical protein